MIAIHNDLKKSSFQHLWIDYCKTYAIPYKLVNAYASNIIDELKDCTAFMWHHYQADARDLVMAKSLLSSLEQSGMNVFPDFNTAWHFDDKVGQKYLLEALQIDLVKTWVFYDRETAKQWIEQTSFPKVFKLRGGAGSQNVWLVHSKKEASVLVKKAFGKGFPAYDGWGSLKERIRKWRLGKANAKEVVKGIVRLVQPPRYAKVMGSEMNYLYFQEFMPNNDSDIRIVVIDGKAFGIKRMNRENDFRASGSGFIRYEKEQIDEIFVKEAFAIHKKLNAFKITHF
jgi:glutathione synthase/RimK-type ligase-like ATP-grasp enzyme